ncbi:MAG: hypothetical protein AAF639_09555 [Chloroflexota bacterium]
MIKSFSKWKIHEVEEEFQVEQQYEYALLDEWIKDGGDVFGDSEQSHTNTLHDLQKHLDRHVYSWNEQELKIEFIGPLLKLIDFYQTHYRPFFEREIAAPYKNETLSGEVDFVIANGLRIPKQPYFFIHEHKKEANSDGDPLGQVMIAMVAAQMLNQDEHPIYGAYIVGRYWNFVVLNGKEYAVSRGYDASLDDIKHIYRILKKIKTIISRMTNLSCI